MIVVKVELHSVRDGEVTEIGRTVIANDGTGDRKRRNYDVAVGRRGDISLRGVARQVVHVNLDWIEPAVRMEPRGQGWTGGSA